MSFDGKVVFVTGASSGIGAAIAIAFAKEGAHVVLVGRNEDKLQKVFNECRKFGIGTMFVKADVSNEEDAKRSVKETIDSFDRIDILVNNAGQLGFSSVFDPNMMQVYDSLMNVNLRAQVYLTHLIAPHLVKTRGNIINISSVTGTVIKVPQMTCYAVTKCALQHFTRGLAAELAPHGVRVNSISPGPVRTSIMENAGCKNTWDSIGKTTPLKRVSEPEEVADLVLYLASEKAKGITGSDIKIDNGDVL